MKEYIEKAVALEALSKSGVTCNMRAHKIVASIQATDVVPVVRCRECARAEESVHPNTVVCVEHGKTMLESDFCSYGEKAN